jgi:hypothetical protein
MKKNPWITDVAALNALADAVRKYKIQPDRFNQLAMFQALDRAENGMSYKLPPGAQENKS